MLSISLEYNIYYFWVCCKPTYFIILAKYSKFEFGSSSSISIISS